MAKVATPDDSLLLVGTFRYMHPSLRKRQSATSSFQALRLHLRGSLLPVIDTYALGVIALQMLSGSPDVPPRLTEERLGQHLALASPALRQLPAPPRDRLISLLFALLSQSIDKSQVSARDALRGLREIAQDIQGLEVHPRPEARTPPPDRDDGKLLARLDEIADSLLVTSQAFIAQSEALRVVTTPASDHELLSDLTAVFLNALQRTKTSWRFTVGMASLIFLIVTSMIVAAVVSVFVTDRNYWPLLFGGLGAATVLGTLWWRPFDRVFHATLLCQQIELIHVQTIAGFRSTTDVETRLRIYDQAILSLRTLLQEYRADAPLGSRRKERGYEQQ